MNRILLRLVDERRDLMLEEICEELAGRKRG